MDITMVVGGVLVSPGPSAVGPIMEWPEAAAQSPPPI
jgi:hypothetical protein